MRKPEVFVKTRYSLSEISPHFQVIESRKVQARSATFDFERVFGPDESVFDLIGTDLIDYLLNRNNACVLAYGQSGSGKSHTMLGSERDRPGLTQQLLRQLIRAKPPSWRLKIGCVEVYRDLLYDLANSAAPLKLRVSNGVAFVENLTTIELANDDEIEGVVTRLVNARRTAATAVNERSSRSHLVLHCELWCDDCAVSKLCLVDLAGSERVNATHCTGELFEDAKQINLSLTVLGNIISSLQAPAAESRFLRFRDHKLTHLLQPCLMAFTVFICCINPLNVNETLNTLQFAAQARAITAHPQLPLTVEQQLRQEIAMLRQLLVDQGGRPEVDEHSQSGPIAADWQSESAVQQPQTPRASSVRRLAAEQEAVLETHFLCSVSGGLSATPVYQRFSGLPSSNRELVCRFSPFSDDSAVDDAPVSAPTPPPSPPPPAEVSLARSPHHAAASGKWTDQCLLSTGVPRTEWRQERPASAQVTPEDYLTYQAILKNIGHLTEQLGVEVVEKISELVDLDLELIGSSLASDH